MDFIPGFIQAIVRVTISYPFDTIKIYSQKNGKTPLRNFIRNFKYNRSSFYRGSSIIYISISIERSIQFKYYEYFNKKYNPIISGFLISLPLSLFTIPSQCITNNIILEKENISSNIKYISKYIKNNGIKSCYRGYFIELPRYLISTSIYLGIYGNLRKEDDTKLDTIKNTLISSYSSWLFSYPIDLIKTLAQTDINWKHTIKERIKNKGFLCLWNGISPVLIRTAPSSICGMLTYEYVRKLIN
jgi:hypothetical protein